MKCSSPLLVIVPILVDVRHVEQREQGGICRVGSRGTSPSLDLTFPPTGLSENLGGMERGRGGKGKGGGDHLPYFPPSLASVSNTTLSVSMHIEERLADANNVIYPGTSPP